ncbi:PhnD/SsuA/transferrin family substrate-binding protein [Nitratidesulfovibrio sp. HK-II]|uniref:phosphate/phosphite/phosphonate ABC transporter substrate-binding protein n=1 Tax=Nitratidesulfovibrio sp. HK-II TaxID=2009266 RepID=UPI0015599A70|nr:PhnD/SsuA/transferrin family substrate-binding protein [Nitratidesulfovibrio sp. HK-II]
MIPAPPAHGAWRATARGMAAALLVLLASAWLLPTAPAVATELRLGYVEYSLPGVDRKDVALAVELWARRYVETERGLGVRLTGYHSRNEMRKALAKGQVDVVHLPTVDYLLLSREMDLKPFGVPVTDGEYGERYVLVAAKGSGITQVSQLRGARLLVQAMSAGPESLPLRWVERQLRDQGLPVAARHFSGVEFEVQASRVLLPVFFGQAPACVITERSLRTMVELNPQVGAQLERIAVSPPLIDFVMCLAPSVDPSLAPRYAELGLGLSDNPWGRQMLLLLQLDGIAPFRAEAIEPARRLVEQ